MAVTAVQLLREERDALHELQNGRHSYNAAYQVETNDRDDGPLAAVMAVRSLIPLGSTYALGNYFDPLAVCKAIGPATPHQEDPQLCWIVPVQWDTDLGNDSPERSVNPDGTPKSPLDRPPLINGDFNRVDESVQQDADGNAYLNSAGTPFLPPIISRRANQLITVTINRASVDNATLVLLQDAINNADWYGFPKWSVKVNGTQFSNQYEQGFEFWPHVYHLEANWKLWHPQKILDQGYYERDPVSNKLTQILDQYGEPLSEPHLLNGAGLKLPSGESAVFLEFREFLELDFITYLF